MAVRQRFLEHVNISSLPASQLQPEQKAFKKRVSVSGGPLKEHHRRRALRDKRLLPKPKSPARQLGLAKRKKVMPVAEAERLFGGTMRTRNRNLRDLLTDEEQLKRYSLPIWRTEEELAAALGISLKELWFFAIHRERERQPHYITFSIPKRSGGKRLIMAPKRRLKMVQRKLLMLLVERLPVSEHAHAFRRGRSIRTGAEPHVGKRFVSTNRFPTCGSAPVRMLRPRRKACACSLTGSLSTSNIRSFR